MLDAEFLNTLRCPACARENKGKLLYHRESWLLCTDCGRKYPIPDGIPCLLVAEGDRWKNTAQQDLPVPPPNPAA